MSLTKVYRSMLNSSLLTDCIDITDPQYGASTTASAAANTIAIHSAFAAAMANADGVLPVFIPAGTFEHTGLTVPAGTGLVIFGVSRDSSILYNTSTSSSSLTLYTDNISESVNNLTVQDIRLTGVGTSGSAVYAVTPGNNPFRDLLFQRVSINRHKNGYYTSGFQNCQITGPCQISGNGNAITGVMEAGSYGIYLGPTNLINISNNIYIALFERCVTSEGAGPAVINACILGTSTFCLENVSGNVYVDGGTYFESIGALAGVSIAVIGAGGYTYLNGAFRTSNITQQKMVVDPNQRTYGIGNERVRIVANTSVATTLATGVDTILRYTPSATQGFNNAASGLVESTGIWTVPITGYYNISAMLEIVCKAANDNLFMQIIHTPIATGVPGQLSNADASAQCSLVGGFFGASLDRIVWLLSGDTITINATVTTTDPSGTLAPRALTLSIQDCGT
jgi:hypothetical protein